jgi:hypothetical protein
MNKRHFFKNSIFAGMSGMKRPKTPQKPIFMLDKRLSSMINNRVLPERKYHHATHATHARCFFNLPFYFLKNVGNYSVFSGLW